MKKENKQAQARADNARDASAVEERATPTTPVIYEVVRRYGED